MGGVVGKDAKYRGNSRFLLHLSDREVIIAKLHQLNVEDLHGSESSSQFAKKRSGRSPPGSIVATSHREASHILQIG